MMNSAIIKELSEIIHSDSTDKDKLLKIEVLVGLAEKLQTPPPQTTLPPATPTPRPQPNGPGAIVSVESL